MRDVAALPRAKTRPAAKKVRPARLLRKLKVKKQTSAGYSRSRFRHWVDADGNCRDTRAEVLVRQSRRTTTGGCRIVSGRWRSPYDGQTFTSASSLDIDHLVPLAEAWRSGAKSWSAGTRKRFANDLRYRPSLIAVSASTNRSKGDREPHRWMPPNQKHGCKYVARWTAVKWRWRLSVDPAEHRFIQSRLSSCGKVKIAKPKRAKIVKRSGGKSGGTGTSTGSTAPRSGTDPRFAYCYEAKAAGYGPYYRGRDVEYSWYRDGDGDGVVCE